MLLHSAKKMCRNFILLINYKTIKEEGGRTKQGGELSSSDLKWLHSLATMVEDCSSRVRKQEEAFPWGDGLS